MRIHIYSRPKLKMTMKIAYLIFLFYIVSLSLWCRHYSSRTVAGILFIVDGVSQVKFEYIPVLNAW